MFCRHKSAAEMHVCYPKFTVPRTYSSSSTVPPSFILFICCTLYTTHTFCALARTYLITTAYVFGSQLPLRTVAVQLCSIGYAVAAALTTCYRYCYYHQYSSIHTHTDTLEHKFAQYKTFSHTSTCPQKAAHPTSIQTHTKKTTVGSAYYAESHMHSFALLHAAVHLVI